MYGFPERWGEENAPASDLACERRRADPAIEGVSYKKEEGDGFSWERIVISSDEGEKSIGRPRGHYDTLTLARMDTLEEERLDDAGDQIATELCRLFDADGILPGRLLVVGLGNADLTPDAIGPRTAKRVHATLHIRDYAAKYFDELECSEIAVCAPGVLAESGMEACEAVIGLCDRITPDAVIAIDALAARASERLGRTIQISDTGIFPGSGIGNSLAPLSEKTLGIPVFAIGVPTVIDARLFLAEEGGAPEKAKTRREPMFVSPREIDGITTGAATIISRGINQAFGIL